VEDKTGDDRRHGMEGKRKATCAFTFRCTYFSSPSKNTNGMQCLLIIHYKPPSFQLFIFHQLFSLHRRGFLLVCIHHCQHIFLEPYFMFCYEAETNPLLYIQIQDQNSPNRSVNPIITTPFHPLNLCLILRSPHPLEIPCLSRLSVLADIASF